MVVDESQRCWSAAWAVAKTRDKAVPLTQSEPAHLLETMARHNGFCALICLVGGGQEIHSGEGGLAEWGDALRQAAAEGITWRIRAAPDFLRTTDPRQRLGALTDLQTIAALHLSVPLRQIRSPAAATWVDLVLAGNAKMAGAIAKDAGEVPFLLTRDPVAMRDGCVYTPEECDARDYSQVRALHGCARKGWGLNYPIWTHPPLLTGSWIDFRKTFARPTRWRC